jgi:hypothetical protein
MKNETLKRLLLPIGLLCITGISFFEHFIKLEVSDFAQGFLKGIGIALMLLGVLFMQRCRKPVSS